MVYQGTSDLVGILMRHGANVNVANLAGVTPLMSAINFADVDSASTLIKAGASVSATDKAGHDVKWYAEQSKSSLLVNLVREAMR